MVFWLVGVCALLLPTMVTAPINGYGASVDAFPFVCALIDSYNEHGTKGTNFQPFCTGTILTASFVLTTYGCIKRKDTYPRRNDIDAHNIKVMFGSGYSWIPEASAEQLSEDEKNRLLIKSWNRYDKHYYQREPVPTQKDDPYQYGDVESYIFPDLKDFEEVFDSATVEQIRKSPEFNAYYEIDIEGNTYVRYYLDFAVLQLVRKIWWDDFTLPGIFPLFSAPQTNFWWEKKWKEERDGSAIMDSCYFIGWGGWDNVFGSQVRLKAVEVRYVPYDNCEVSYCTECSYCNQTWRINSTFETCYKTAFYGDTCTEDEGGPVWCPWAGVQTRTKDSEAFKTGAILGILSYSPRNCSDTPSLFSNSWRAYTLISRAVGYDFPPPLIVYEDVFRNPPLYRIYSHDEPRP